MTDYRMHDQQMTQWWTSPLGQRLEQSERDALFSLKHLLYGYYQVQIGGNSLLLPGSKRPEALLRVAEHADVAAHPENLPFKSHSIDSLMLMHVLEFSADPHQMLREAERVLVDDGTLVLCCFNPLSLWGIKRLFSWQDRPPWNGHFFSRARTQDWLALLNFQVIDHRPLGFILPSQSARLLNWTGFLQRWGARLWPVFCGVTILVASKHTVPLTPLTVRWRRSALFPKTRLVNRPLTRHDKHTGNSKDG